MPLTHATNKKLRKMMKRLLEKPLFKIGRNAKYCYQQFMELIIPAALRNRSIENQSETDGKVSADDLFHHLQKLVIGRIQWLLQYQIALVKRLVKSSGFTLDATIAIDKTEEPYWGSSDNLFVTGGKRENSTNYAFRQLTAVIAVHNQAFIIYAKPLTKEDKDDALLVENCILSLRKEGIEVKRVLLDREFYNSDLVFASNVHDVEYIIPVVQNSKFQRLVAELREEKKKLPRIIENYDINDELTNLVIYEDENSKGETEIFGFITNIEADIIAEDVYAIVESYRNRWCIENAHKFQDSFIIPTNSTDGKVRFFFFIVGVLLHNFWVLLNLIGNIFGIGEISLSILKDILSAAYEFAAIPHYKHPQRKLWVKLLLG